MTFHILILYIEITAAVETKLFSAIKKKLCVFKNKFLLSLEGELMLLYKMSGQFTKLLSGPNKYHSENLQMSGQILPLIMSTEEKNFRYGTEVLKFEKKEKSVMHILIKKTNQQLQIYFAANTSYYRLQLPPFNKRN